jgi:hypothetical protein
MSPRGQLASGFYNEDLEVRVLVGQFFREHAQRGRTEPGRRVRPAAALVAHALGPVLPPERRRMGYQSSIGQFDISCRSVKPFLTPAPGGLAPREDGADATFEPEVTQVGAREGLGDVEAVGG